MAIFEKIYMLNVLIVRLSLLRKTILNPEYLAFMCVCVFVDGCTAPLIKCKISQDRNMIFLF